jgi:antirestriction protein ArdC
MKEKEPNRAVKLLVDSVSALMSAETYRAALAFRQKLHQYSFGNCWLIYKQCPHASYVAGYRRWQELGRQVKKGETSIAIMAPLTRFEVLNPKHNHELRDIGDLAPRKEQGDNGEDKYTVFGFRASSVFDISQTEGEAVPEYPKPQILSDDSETIQATLKRLEQFATTRGFPITRKDLEPGTMGSFSHRDGQITLSLTAPPLQQVKTLVHEVAHALIHCSESTRPYHVHELEAESCAFLVCHTLGLDTSRYSFAYLANWAEDPEELLPSAERACKTADQILLALTS